jgi:hypothetical protein
MDVATCLHCSEEVTTDSDFCPYCGTLFVEGKDVFCDEHSKKSALGVCIICQKLVCDECSDSPSSRSFTSGEFFFRVSFPRSYFVLVKILDKNFRE